ncbi:MAG: hypothetical protein Q9186_005920 [Xanthomendoza sp. 1 TL-2023]
MATVHPKPTWPRSKQCFLIAVYSNFDVTYAELATAMTKWTKHDVSASEVEKEHMRICREMDRNGGPGLFGEFYGYQNHITSPGRALHPAHRHKDLFIELTQSAIEGEVDACDKRIKGINRKNVKFSSSEYDDIIIADVIIANEVERLQVKLRQIEDGEWPRHRHWPTMLWYEPWRQEGGPSPHMAATMDYVDVKISEAIKKSQSFAYCHSSVEVKQEKGTDTFHAKFKEVTPRRILAKHVEVEIENMEAMDGKEHQAYVYRLNFIEENNASGFTYKSKKGLENLSFDILKPSFAPTYTTPASYPDNTRAWKLEDGEEIIYIAG